MCLHRHKINRLRRSEIVFTKEFKIILRLKSQFGLSGLVFTKLDIKIANDAREDATTLSITILSTKGLFATFSITTFSTMIFGITMLYHYAECRILITIMLNVIMLSVSMLNVVAPSVVISE
jgi:hypothetical protein